MLVVFAYSVWPTMQIGALIRFGHCPRCSILFLTCVTICYANNLATCMLHELVEIRLVGFMDTAKCSCLDPKASNDHRMWENMMPQDSLLISR